MRRFVMAPRMSGKRALVEAMAKQSGAVLCTPEGYFKWDGEHWKKLKKAKS